MSKEQQRKKSAFSNGERDRKQSESEFISDHKIVPDIDYNEYILEELRARKPQKKYLYVNHWYNGWKKQDQILRMAKTMTEAIEKKKETDKIKNTEIDENDVNDKIIHDSSIEEVPDGEQIIFS